MTVSALPLPPEPVVPADSCSLPADENLPGTAAVEQAWVLLEHPGGWGRDVLDGSAFGEELSAALKQKMVDAGARLLLIRRPGREGQQVRLGGARRAFVAVTGGAGGVPVLYSFEVADARELLDLPLDRPENIASAVVSRETLVLVCTYSKRDRCCAVRGRPIAAFLAEQAPQVDVWECSHTGGHRFAPVGLTLPTGYTYGRLTFESALVMAQEAAAGRVAVEGLRGRSCHSPIEQVAEAAIRTHLAQAGQRPGVADLTVTALDPVDLPRLAGGEGSAPEGSAQAARVQHSDGRSWLVEAQAHPLEPRPASCGKAPAPAESWEVTSIIDSAKHLD